MYLEDSSEYARSGANDNNRAYPENNVGNVFA